MEITFKERLNKVKTFCRPYLASIHREGLFRYYTTHDESHSSEVCRVAMELAGNRLTACEMFLLGAACWFHDVGMAKWKTEDYYQYDDPGYCNSVRETHSRRSEELVNIHYREAGLEGDEARVIGRVCYAHVSKARLSELDQTDSKLQVRTRLLGALLRIADMLDAREDRLPAGGYRKDAPFESKVEYLKHKIVRGVDVSENKIEIMICKEPEGMSPKGVVEQVKRKLEEDFKSVADTLNENHLDLDQGIKYTEEGCNELRDWAEGEHITPPEIERIMELYVEPSNFRKIMEKLEKYSIVIITGDADVGKTSTAFYIAGRYFEGNKKPPKIYRCGDKPERIEDCVVVLDDPFGESRFGDWGCRVGLNEILGLKEKNTVIITSRKQVLIDATRESRLGESRLGDWIVEITQEGSYNSDALKAILRKHIEFYKKEGRIDEEDKKLATENEDLIVGSLRFPHNIDVFVRENLKEVREGKELRKAIEDARWIKNVSKNWFLSLDDTRKYFIFTVSLFPAHEHTFKEIYPKVVEVLRKRKPGLEIGNVKDLRTATSSYINIGDFVDFRHPDYREGIDEAVVENFGDSMSDLIPLLGVLIGNRNKEVVSSVIFALGLIGEVHLDNAIEMLERLARDEDMGVGPNVASTLAYIGNRRPENVFRLLWSLVEDGKRHTRELVVDTLWFLGLARPDDVFEFLLSLAGKERWQTREVVLIVLGRIGGARPNEAFALLRRLAEDKNFCVRSQVASALSPFLGLVRPDDALILLRRLAEDKNEVVRLSVAQTLGQIGEAFPDDAFILLRSLAEDEDIVVKGVVAGAIGGIGEAKFDDVVPLLRKLAANEDEEVREAVAVSMGLVGEKSPDKTIKMLRSWVEDKKWKVRKVAADALGRIGKTRFADVADLLTILCEDENEVVRATAKHLLVNKCVISRGIEVVK